jgi:4-hydroxy-2-oxoheptanedioate aldolase
LIGIFVKIPAMAVVETLGIAGVDFLIIDLEHSALGFEAAEALVVAADAVGISSVIRIADKQEHLVTKALDLGCDGAQVPMIENRKRHRNTSGQPGIIPCRSPVRYVRPIS